MEPLLFSISEAARLLRIGRSKTYELIAAGKILTITIGRRRLVKAESIRAIANGEVIDEHIK